MKGPMPLKLWREEGTPKKLSQDDTGLMFGYTQPAIQKMEKAMELGERHLEVLYIGYSENRGQQYKLQEVKKLATGFHPYLV